MALIPTKMKLRQDTLANWLAINPVLQQAEPGWENDNGIMRIGDGVTPFMELPRFITANDLSETGLGAPAGAIVEFPFLTAPTGFLVANGAALSRTTYADLFAAIDTLHGAGDGSTTFNIPDYRGIFIRGADQGRGVDPGRVVGTEQMDDIKSHAHGWSGTVAEAGSHNHGASTGGAGGHDHYMFGQSGRLGNSRNPDFVATSIGENNYGQRRTQGVGDHAHSVTINFGGSHAHSVSGSVASAGGTETRPRNSAALICIKF